VENKKGISAVVATVLIILITVAAVTIIWAAIIPMINDQLARGTICLDAMTQINIESKGYTCYDSVNNVAKVQIKHGAKDIGLVGLQILISEEGSTTSNETRGNMPVPNEEMVLNIPYSNKSADGPESVKVAPIVEVGGSEETCDALGDVKLTAC